jgi:hypothetical protein
MSRSPWPNMRHDLSISSTVVLILAMIHTVATPLKCCDRYTTSAVNKLPRPILASQQSSQLCRTGARFVFPNALFGCSKPDVPSLQDGIRSISRTPTTRVLARRSLGYARVVVSTHSRPAMLLTEGFDDSQENLAVVSSQRSDR